MSRAGQCNCRSASGDDVYQNLFIFVLPRVCVAAPKSGPIQPRDTAAELPWQPVRRPAPEAWIQNHLVARPHTAPGPLMRRFLNRDANPPSSCGAEQSSVPICRTAHGPRRKQSRDTVRKPALAARPQTSHQRSAASRHRKLRAPPGTLKTLNRPKAGYFLTDYLIAINETESYDSQQGT